MVSKLDLEKDLQVTFDELVEEIASLPEDPKIYNIDEDPYSIVTNASLNEGQNCIRKYINRKLKYQSPSVFYLYIAMLLSLHRNRMTIFAEYLTSSKLLAVLRTIRILNIHSSFTSKATDSKPVTLNKIASCFPETAMKLFNYLKVPLIVDDIEPDFPYPMRVRSFACLIPQKPDFNREPIWEVIKKAFIFYQCKVSIIRQTPTNTTSSNRKYITKDLIAMHLDYLSDFILYSSLSDKERQDAVFDPQYKIVDFEGNLTKTLIKYAETFDLIYK